MAPSTGFRSMGSDEDQDVRIALLTARVHYLRREIVRSLGAQLLATTSEERDRLLADEECLRRMVAKAEEALMHARGTPMAARGLSRA